MTEPSDDELPEELFHYTDQAGFRGIVETGSFWLTHHAFLNDPTELHAGDREFQKLAVAATDTLGEGRYREFLERIGSSPQEWERIREAQAGVFLMSFTGGADSLYHWRGYGKGRNAVVLGLNALELAVVAGSGGASEAIPTGETVPTEPYVCARLVPCLYDAQGLARAFCASTEKPAWASQIDVEEWRILETMMKVMELRSRFKLKAFEEEKEWRLVFTNGASTVLPTTPSFRTVGGALVPYVELPLYPFTVDPKTRRIPLRSVRLGPQCEETVELAVRMCLDAHGYKDVPVLQSKPDSDDHPCPDTFR